jgi:hypothetical protein
MNINERKESLKTILSSLDDRLIDFKQLVFDMISYELNYSIESIKYVELVIKHLKNKIKNDQELKKDAALYIGETIRKHHGGEWQVYSKEDSPYFGLPNIVLQDKDRFFPFVSMEDYLANPSRDFFISQFIKVN